MDVKRARAGCHFCALRSALWNDGVLFSPMPPWAAKTIIVVSTALLIVIPALVHRRDGKFAVAKNGNGPLERLLLTLVSLSLLPLLLWVTTPALAFADYRLRPLPMIAGVSSLVLGLWLLFRSHLDLGSNWSITLEVRE